jgi:hypothetical protein
MVYCFYVESVKSPFRILLVTLALLASTAGGQAQISVTNYFSTTNAQTWQIAGGGVTNATGYEVKLGSYFPQLSIFSDGDPDSCVAGVTNFTGFWLADYIFWLPYGASNISLTYWQLFVRDRGLLLLNGNPIIATGNPFLGNYNSGALVLTDGGSPQPYSFVGLNGSVTGTVTNGFDVGGFNTLRVIINQTFQGVIGSDLPVSALDTVDTVLSLSGAVSYTLEPSVSLVKAVKPSFYNLSPGTNYQLQVSADLSTWTNQGSAFTATNSSMVYPQYWDVDSWGQLFFRLQVTP